MKILVLFVEPMLYIMDLIHEVYEQTPYDFYYIFCTSGLTGKDHLILPENTMVCTEKSSNHVKQIKKKICSWEPDFAVINGYAGYEQTAMILYCKRHHIPYAIESDTPLHIPKNRISAICKKIWLHRLLHNHYCYGFPGGTPQKENLRYYGIAEERNYIMPMSVSFERLMEAYESFPPKEQLKHDMRIEKGPVFLYVGRLAPEKNVSLLIDAFKRFNDSDAVLLIVGDGKEKQELELRAKEEDRIIFLGYQVYPELIKYYKVSDFLVLPSLHEPWGLVVNEAMTLGLPVIVSIKVGCQQDLVKNGENGFVFNNDLEDLITVFEQLKTVNYPEMSKCAKCMMMKWNYELYKMNFMKAIKGITHAEAI